jgi:hypothetical protein
MSFSTLVFNTQISTMVPSAATTQRILINLPKQYVLGLDCRVRSMDSKPVLYIENESLRGSNKYSSSSRTVFRHFRYLGVAHNFDCVNKSLVVYRFSTRACH